MSDALRSVVRDNAFVLEADDGETWTIAGTNSSIRFVLDEKSAPFALVHSRANPDDPVPPHLHKHAIDTWWVLQGKLSVWNGNEGRVLSAGDFAFVPPGHVHTYQVIEPHTEFLGLIHPAEWVSFFKALGEPFEGPGLFPSKDTREFPKGKFIQAIKDGHDVVPQFGHKFPEASHEWSDSTIPSEPAPYYLKANRGERYALGNFTLSPITSSEVSSGKFSINTLEAHSSLPCPAELSSLSFRDRCVLVFAHAGAWNLDVDGNKSVLHAGDSAYVPPGAKFSLLPKGKFARAHVFSDGPAHEVLFKAAGVLTTGVVGAESAELTEAQKSKLAQVSKESGITLGQ